VAVTSQVSSPSGEQCPYLPTSSVDRGYAYRDPSLTELGEQQAKGGTPPQNILPLALPDYSRSLFAGVIGLRIGILKEAFEFEVMDLRVKSAVLSAAEKFNELGAEVVEISFRYMHLRQP
jgi:Asp-tRNA(Asn)/Glu-tRNA(Gln) amidotransferase A subunit family amidase